jgi:hypothetical protein
MALTQRVIIDPAMNLSSPSGIDPGSLVPGLVAALNGRDADRVLALMAPDVTLEVRARRGIEETANEDLWRAVSVRGDGAVREYLVRLFRALPSLTVRVDEQRGVPCWENLLADMAGVDGDGVPFEAAAQIRLRGDGNAVRRVSADVVHVATGHDLLRRTDRDPRRYFGGLLEPPRKPV